MRCFTSQSVEDMIDLPGSGQNKNGEFVLASRTVDCFIRNRRVLQKRFKQNRSEVVSARKKDRRNFCFRYWCIWICLQSHLCKEMMKLEKKECREKRSLRKALSTARLRNKGYLVVRMAKFEDISSDSILLLNRKKSKNLRKIDCSALRKPVKLTKYSKNSPFKTLGRSDYVPLIDLMPYSLKLLIPLRAFSKHL